MNLLIHIVKNLSTCFSLGQFYLFIVINIQLQLSNHRQSSKSKKVPINLFEPEDIMY